MLMFRPVSRCTRYLVPVDPQLSQWNNITLVLSSSLPAISLLDEVTRVCLLTPSGQPRLSDYINANYIKVVYMAAVPSVE